MPCYEPRDDYDEREIDKLTKLLCEACRKLENIDLECSSELQVWWKKHRKFDKKEGR